MPRLGAGDTKSRDKEGGKAWQPQADRGAMLQPMLDELRPGHQVHQPAGQWLEERPRGLRTEENREAWRSAAVD